MRPPPAGADEAHRFRKPQRPVTTTNTGSLCAKNPPPSERNFAFPPQASPAERLLSSGNRKSRFRDEYVPGGAAGARVVTKRGASSGGKRVQQRTLRLGFCYYYYYYRFRRPTSRAPGNKLLGSRPFSAREELGAHRPPASAAACRRGQRSWRGAAYTPDFSLSPREKNRDARYNLYYAATNMQCPEKCCEAHSLKTPRQERRCEPRHPHRTDMQAETRSELCICTQTLRGQIHICHANNQPQNNSRKRSESQPQGRDMCCADWSSPARTKRGRNITPVNPSLKWRDMCCGFRRE